MKTRIVIAIVGIVLVILFDRAMHLDMQSLCANDPSIEGCE